MYCDITKEKIIAELLDNIPKNYRHNPTIQQKKEFISFRSKLPDQIRKIKLSVDKTNVFGFYDVQIKYFQNKPHVVNLELSYRMKGLPRTVKENMNYLKTRVNGNEK